MSVKINEKSSLQCIISFVTVTGNGINIIRVFGHATRQAFVTPVSHSTVSKHFSYSAVSNKIINFENVTSINLVN